MIMHGQGIGTKVWKAIENHFPETKVWSYIHLILKTEYPFLHK